MLQDSKDCTADNQKTLHPSDRQTQEKKAEEEVHTQLLHEEKLVAGITWIFLFVWIIGCALLCRSAMSVLM